MSGTSAQTIQTPATHAGKRSRKFQSEDVTRERWLRGRLGYKLHAGQRKIDDAVSKMRKQLFLGEIARQFGKSYWLVVKALEEAFRRPKAKVKYGTAFQTDLLEFILPTFDIVMDDCPEDLRPVWKSQKSKFILPHNGSEIKLVGLDRKPNGLRGNVIDLIILDEAGFMSRLDYLYKSVIIPATTHRPECKVLVFSTPPETPDHEFCSLAEKAEFEGSYLKLIIYDNPMLGPKDHARLMEESGGEHSSTWKREYLCMRVTDANLQIIAEWDDAYWKETPHDDYFPLYHRYVGMDLGVSRDFTAPIFGYYDFKRGALVIEDELVVNGPTLTTEIIHEAIVEKENALWPGLKTHLRVADNNNPLLLQDLSLIHGLHFIPTDKGRLAEMVNTVKIRTRSGGLLIHPRCKQLRGCLKYGIWDKNRAKFGNSKVYGHYDALASLIYLIRNLDTVTNPIPHTFQTDPQNQMILVRENLSSAAGQLKAAFGGRK